MLNGRLVVVVVPAFSEEAFVGAVIDTMPSFVDRILVVDDGSPDRTSEVARARNDARVTVLRHVRRSGVGAAITTGYREALAHEGHEDDAIAVMAGDGQMHPDDLEAIVTPISLGELDYVKGDRFGDPKVRSSMGFPRWVGGQVFSRLIRSESSRWRSKMVNDRLRPNWLPVPPGALIADWRRRFAAAYGAPEFRCVAVVEIGSGHVGPH